MSTLFPHVSMCSLRRKYANGGAHLRSSKVWTHSWEGSGLRVLPVGRKVEAKVDETG